MSNSDTNIDAENIGNSSLVAYLVISMVLIIGYVIDGREFIQESILEVSSISIKKKNLTIKFNK